MTTDNIDLGEGVYFRWLAFAPDRDLNPHLAHLADNDHTGIIVGHVHDDGYVCEGGVLFDTPENTDPARKSRVVWHVESLEPLTISPSVLFTLPQSCGLHGFIKEGRWVSA